MIEKRQPLAMAVEKMVIGGKGFTPNDILKVKELENPAAKQQLAQKTIELGAPTIQGINIDNLIFPYIKSVPLVPEEEDFTIQIELGEKRINLTEHSGLFFSTWKENPILFIGRVYTIPDLQKYVSQAFDAISF